MQTVSPILNGHPVDAAQAATDDPILYWNGVALKANLVSHTNGLGEQAGPPLSARALAIVHLAMYDAYAKVMGNPADLPPYLDLPQVTLPALPSGVTLDEVAKAAVASAAHETLTTLFPSQSPAFNKALMESGDPTSPGHLLGWQVAQAILWDRDKDPGAGADGYKPMQGRYQHRTDPDNPSPADNPLRGYHAPFYGKDARGFAITRRHSLDAPPKGNAVYAAALKEVLARGIAPQLMGTLPAGLAGRTPEQTLRGIFWGYDGAAGLGTPPRFYNQIVCAIAIARNNTVAENARLFALVNVAMADAGILAWEQKYDYNFWRPILGIREHDGSMGFDTSSAAVDLDDLCDPCWLPLGAPSTNRSGVKNFTPPFPAYPSGHATFGAAALHITRLFYGVPTGDRRPDNVFSDGAGKKLTLVSDEFNGVNQDNHGTVRSRHERGFDGGLWEMIIENGTSRVDLGVHWIFDAFGFTQDEDGHLQPDLTQTRIGGVPLGLAIAEDIFNGGRANGMKPTPVASAAAEAEALEGVEAAARGGSWRDRVPYLPPSEEILRVRR